MESTQYLVTDKLVRPHYETSKSPLFPEARVSAPTNQHPEVQLVGSSKHATLLLTVNVILTVYRDPNPFVMCTLFSQMSFLPTPAMSGEFPKPASDAFTLPPAALSPESRRSSHSDPSYTPGSQSPNLSTRRASHTGRSGPLKRSLEDFDLPPPPTRTRKIIQMKPKMPAKSKDKDNGATQSPEPMPNPPTNSKNKQPSATSAAGRKIARKTAHSLIERRRRSKMNEEFGTLKDMIPACTGQEMHKLAILQVLPLKTSLMTSHDTNHTERQALTTSTT